MALYTWFGKLIFISSIGGGLAIDEACCCHCLGPCFNCNNNWPSPGCDRDIEVIVAGAADTIATCDCVPINDTYLFDLLGSPSVSDCCGRYLVNDIWPCEPAGEYLIEVAICPDRVEVQVTINEGPSNDVATANFLLSPITADVCLGNVVNIPLDNVFYTNPAMPICDFDSLTVSIQLL